MRAVDLSGAKVTDGAIAYPASVPNEWAGKQPDATDPAGRQPTDTVSGFNDLGEEFAVPRKVRTDTIMTTVSYPSSTQREIESADLRSVRLGQPGSRAHPPSPPRKSCEAHRIAATNINFSVRSGCSRRSRPGHWTASGQDRIPTLQRNNAGKPKPNSIVLCWRHTHGRRIKRVQPVMTCAAGPAWQRPRLVRRRSDEAHPQL